MQSLVVHVHRGIRINIFVSFYPFFFANEYISEFNKAMGFKCKHRRRVVRFFCQTMFLILFFLYKINFASASNLETIRTFSPFSGLVDIDVFTGLFCYFQLLSLQKVIIYIFSNFWKVDVQLVSHEPCPKHVQKVYYLLFMIKCVIFSFLNLFSLL